LILIAACVSVAPSTARTELFVTYASGGVWPSSYAVRLFADGTLEAQNTSRTLRTRISPGDRDLMRLRSALEESSFQSELEAAAVPSPEWRSSGAWFRIERGGTVGMLKPPLQPLHIRAVISDLDALLTRYFGKRYTEMTRD
jgi:hypothetical protein